MSPQLRDLEAERARLDGDIASARKEWAALQQQHVENIREVLAPVRQLQRGDLTTHSGGLWHCSADSREEPGTGPARVKTA
jgi:hypothetical protein